MELNLWRSSYYDSVGGIGWPGRKGRRPIDWHEVSVILRDDALFDISLLQQRQEATATQRKHRLLSSQRIKKKRTFRSHCIALAPVGWYLEAVHFHRMAAHFSSLAGRSEAATVPGQVPFAKLVRPHSKQIIK